jgi:hypothetical protein
MQKELPVEENKSLALTERAIEPIVENGNGNGQHELVPTKKLPVSKQISNEQLIAEEKALIEKETEIEVAQHQVSRPYTIPSRHEKRRSS